MKKPFQRGIKSHFIGQQKKNCESNTLEQVRGDGPRILTRVSHNGSSIDNLG